MNLKEAFSKFNTANTVCIVVHTKEGLRAITENNFWGGVCGCCAGFEASDDLVVEKIVDMSTMEVFYSE